MTGITWVTPRCVYWQDNKISLWSIGNQGTSALEEGFEGDPQLLSEQSHDGDVLDLQVRHYKLTYQSTIIMSFKKRKVVWHVPIYHLKSTNINFSLITQVNILYFNLCLLVPSNKRMPALISIWNKCIYFNMDQSHMSDIWFRQSVIRLKRRLSYLIRLAEWIFIIYCRAHITLLLVHFCWFSNLNFILNTNLCTYNSRAGFTFFLFCNTIADFI